jgi:long-chain fatty acid transport protein
MKGNTMRRPDPRPTNRTNRTNRTARALTALAAALAATAASGVASADSGIDSPDSGVVQLGRGSAWVARADDPLAAFFNPAAMAFQATSVHLGAQLIMKSSCFTRVGPNGQPYAPDNGIPAPILAGQTGTGPSATVCGDTPPFPNPQIGAVFRVHKQVAIGLALVAPHSAGKTTWPESLSYTNAFGFPATEPSPQRYLLTNSNALIVFPTVSVAYAPLDNLSFGVGFVWGIGTASFTTFSEAVSPAPSPGMPATDHSGNDVKAELTAKDFFIPGVILSALWMPTSNLDIAGWFKWSDALKASTDLTLTSEYFGPNGAVQTKYCGTLKPPQGAGCNVTNAQNAGTIQVNIPMEAKLGLRYHMPRTGEIESPAWASREDRKVRDPLSQDVFDIELDFTYANNSALQNLQLSFHPGITIADGTAGGVGQVPTNANIPHDWQDVVGIRLGGDWNVIPNRLALRTGGWFETAGQTAKYLALDFDVAMKGGVAGGLTVRAGPIDISAAYQHTFYATLNNGGNGGIYALSGDGSGCMSSKSPSFSQGCYRSWQAVNGGSLTQNLNEVGVSGTARF